MSTDAVERSSIWADNSNIIIIIVKIITLFNVGAKHSYVTIKYHEANKSQLLKPTSKSTKLDHNKFDKTTSRTIENT